MVPRLCSRLAPYYFPLAAVWPVTMAVRVDRIRFRIAATTRNGTNGGAAGFAGLAVRA
ncbi:hypothetical protein I552_10269 [Mycobacterium xenopi 3993]|nr:hypothetical protein I552_10269 [Mycobacterium xenopi 3993]